MKNTFLLLLTLSLFSCKSSLETTQKAFIGTWHLMSINSNTVDKGVIMYSPDGHMAAMLSKKDTIVIGYSGRYKINPQESIVTHFRDFYSILPHPRPDIVPIFIRDYSFSQDGQVLTLKPKEIKGQELVWKKVKP
ncbi:MAG: hypothetical protein KA514_07335 [Cytophagaceae bacterium]|jgi:hypothetical protein|nr:hypothetical protein [Cytophagaceae bacterium]